MGPARSFFAANLVPERKAESRPRWFTLISAPFIVFGQLEGHVSDSVNHFIQETLQLRHVVDEFFSFGEVARVRESFGHFFRAPRTRKSI